MRWSMREDLRHSSNLFTVAATYQMIMPEIKRFKHHKRRTKQNPI